MTVKDIYKIWAPVGKKWVDWVRPVPFVELCEYTEIYSYPDFFIPAIDYVDSECDDTAIIVDLPGMDSVKEGLALAKLGFRPIPSYNGTARQQGARLAPMVRKSESRTFTITGSSTWASPSFWIADSSGAGFMITVRKSPSFCKRSR